jgi:hypothetical protein
MKQVETPDELVGWQPYNLDHIAQELVIENRDKKNVLNESHKMRMSIAYGLERFWGERLRFERENGEESKNKGMYWKSVWVALAKILKSAEIDLPDGDGKVKFSGKDPIKDKDHIKAVADEIWKMNPQDRQAALMVLTQLTESLVWWTQRYKKKG